MTVHSTPGVFMGFPWDARDLRVDLRVILWAGHESFASRQFTPACASITCYVFRIMNVLQAASTQNCLAGEALPRETA